jgi:hypothetical protein
MPSAPQRRSSHRDAPAGSWPPPPSSAGTGIGLSTVLAGWHRPSDVVGGLLVATAWAAGTVAVLTLTDADAFGPERLGMRPALDAESCADASAARRYVLTAVGAVGAGWIATDAVVLRTRASSLDLTHADAAFVWACAAIVGFAAIVFAALLRVRSCDADSATRAYDPVLGRRHQRHLTCDARRPSRLR